ncbi:MAG TPA: immune inhibitor A [Thermoflexales bacterium]|nr:immune inhibitor A [Thermoflexales bacterium]HQW36004.1 immune inhibitor A [Thermoflexales bacterium]HQZ20876.1 immune inhibitor A [Thermoflexales bacterium]HQZ98683.1 immune inhibitor A [Thermoflexales bacterium]
MNRNSWIALIVGLVLACACACLVAGGAGFLFYSRMGNANPSTRLTAVPPGRATSTLAPLRTPIATTAPAGTPSAGKTPIAQATPVSGPVDASTYAAAQNAQEQMPREDLADIATRFRGASPSATTVSCATQAKGYNVGDTRTFKLSNQDSNTQFDITAQLKYKTDNVYMWVETGPKALNINDTKLKQAADSFQQKIYPTTRAFFGSEASPGVDCDAHVHIIHATDIGKTVGGYFSSPDSYPKSVRPDSNEGEMFVIHAAPGYNGSNPGSVDYMSTLAHEFQHMVSHNMDYAPNLWLEEGAAQLSERINGYGSNVGTAFDFASSPDTQLNTWSESSAGENSAHYGGGYLFWSYLYDRFGVDFARKFAQSKERSINALIKIMQESGITNPDTGKAYTFDALFADWVVANYEGKNHLTDNGGAANRFNYTGIDVPMMDIFDRVGASSYPAQMAEKVNQYGTNYYELKGNQPVALAFQGSPTVALLPAADNHGKFWWSNRADVSNSRMTHDIDLSGVQKATLKYRAWYRLEKDYDYGYVTVSTDGGATWKTLKTPSCSTEDPNSANLGCGYTGPSGGDKNNPGWVNETVDLSAYAGKKIQLRFETVTDAGVNREGLAIDDIEIPEIGFKDDGSAQNGWKTEGWLNADNTLPQTWAVQLIVQTNGGKSYAQMVAVTNGAGSAQIAFGKGADDVKVAVLAVSPTTLITTEPGSYSLTLR